MDVFKHAKIARWRHCNADCLKTLKTNYMLMKLLCVPYITWLNMSVKVCFEIPSDCWEKLQKFLWGYFFAAPCSSAGGELVSVCRQPSGSVLDRLESAHQVISVSVVQRFARIHSTGNECMDIPNHTIISFPYCSSDEQQHGKDIIRFYMIKSLKKPEGKETHKKRNLYRNIHMNDGLEVESTAYEFEIRNEEKYHLRYGTHNHSFALYAQ